MGRKILSFFGKFSRRLGRFERRRACFVVISLILTSIQSQEYHSFLMGGIDF